MKKSLYYLYCTLLRNLAGNRIKGRPGNKIHIDGVVLRNVTLDIRGRNNTIHMEPFSRITNMYIRLRGDNHSVHIGEKVVIVSGEMNVIGSACEVSIGNDTTIRDASFNVVGETTRIVLGQDCMFGSNIKVWSGEVHPIYEREGGAELNVAQDIHIGDHVWLGSDVVVLKGVSIGKGSMAGVRTMVTKDIPENALCVGSPARVVKNDIIWNRKRSPQ